MTEEFALCWNNFTENLQTGFRSLFQRDELFDVTLACEGNLLRAHKVVLSLCSPYFQKLFIANPCPNTIVILPQDMKTRLVSNLLEFMYLGSVKILAQELQEFMKIAEALQIKGLTANSKDLLNRAKEADSVNAEPKSGSKRHLDTDESEEEIKFKEVKPTVDITDLTKDDDDLHQIIPMPEISIVESRFDQNNSVDHQSNLKISAAQSLHDFGCYEFNNHLNTPQDFQNKFSNEQVPNDVNDSSSGITMLSSTSLLHGNCVFNRNNTVATQAGLKTYWLCKSYRISMCKARCITFKGKVISATGIHNHLPHMSNKLPEIPPGHTPNVFHSPSSEFPVNNMLPSSQDLLQPQQPQIYNTLLHQLAHTMPNLEASTSESNFKTEHI